jgi:hypothetical protein
MKIKKTPRGTSVLVDEHAFTRDPKTGRKTFVTSYVDNNSKCLRELALSRFHDEMARSHLRECER